MVRGSVDGQKALQLLFNVGERDFFHEDKNFEFSKVYVPLISFRKIAAAIHIFRASSLKNFMSYTFIVHTNCAKIRAFVHEGATEEWNKVAGGGDEEGRSSIIPDQRFSSFSFFFVLRFLFSSQRPFVPLCLGIRGERNLRNGAWNWKYEDRNKFCPPKYQKISTWDRETVILWDDSSWMPHRYFTHHNSQSNQKPTFPHYSSSPHSNSAAGY